MGLQGWFWTGAVLKPCVCLFFGLCSCSWVCASMAVETNSVTMSFVLLLEDIFVVLSIGPPEYRRIGSNRECVVVTVDMKGTMTDRTFYGWREHTVSACYEVAARRMDVFLVRQHNVQVYDVNLDLRLENQQCAQLYSFKYDSLFRIERGIPPASGYEIEPIEGLDCGQYRVIVDFLSLLKDVVEKFGIVVTPMRVFSLSPGVFYASFSIPVPGSNSLTYGVLRYRAATVEEAKQTLAKKAVTLLSMWHRFEVQDVNYFFLPYSSHFMDAEQGMYELIRERVLGIAAPTGPLPCIIEEDCSTPRCERNQIPEMAVPPPPPNRRHRVDQAGTSTTSNNGCLSPDAFSI